MREIFRYCKPVVIRVGDISTRFVRASSSQIFSQQTNRCYVVVITNEFGYALVTNLSFRKTVYWE